MGAESSESKRPHAELIELYVKTPHPYILEKSRKRIVVQRRVLGICPTKLARTYKRLLTPFPEVNKRMV
jgi:hypothetical protein